MIARTKRGTRRAISFMLILSLISGLMAVTAGSALGKPSVGNSANAKLCKNWQSLYRTDGTSFADKSACVSYGANGGVILTEPPVVSNEAPVAVDDNDTIDEDTTLSGNVLDNDTDLDGDALTAIRGGGPAHGSLSLNADGSFTYDPDEHFAGTDSFTYTANDGSADSNEATVTITMNPISDPPQIWVFTLTSNGEETTEICEGQDAVTAHLVGSDPDGNPWTLRVYRDDRLLADSGLTTQIGLTVSQQPAAFAAGEYTYTGEVSEGIDVVTQDITLTVLSAADPTCSLP